MSLIPEASTDPLWQIAIKEKFDALSKNHTWDLVTLPPRNLWLVVSGSIKSRPSLIGSIERYKTCLIAKGFTQEYEIDYE